MTPGAHVAVLGDRAAIGVEGRLLGLELRDTLLVFRPGPSTGFVFLFRAPMTEPTIAAQMLASGTGGLNIGACRVGAAEHERVVHSGKESPVTEAHDGYKRPGRSMYTHKPKERAGPANADGRWPPNILLVHGPECRMVGKARIEGHKGYPNGPGGSSSQFSQKGTRTTRTRAWAGHADAEGKETVPVWDCEVGCPVRVLDEQAGIRLSTLTGRADPNHPHPNPGDNNGKSLFGAGNSHVYADLGGASRFYPQFLDEAELVEWLRTLMGGGAILRDSV